jgi:hypothetical protein
VLGSQSGVEEIVEIRKEKENKGEMWVMLTNVKDGNVKAVYWLYFLF